MKVSSKKTTPPEEKKPPPGWYSTGSLYCVILSVTAGEDPMAEMLARIRSGNVHLKKIEAVTAVSHHQFFHRHE